MNISNRICLTWNDLRHCADEMPDWGDEPVIVMTSAGYVEVDMDGDVYGYGRKLAHVDDSASDMMEQHLDELLTRQRLGADWSVYAWHVRGNVYVVDDEDDTYSLIERDLSDEDDHGRERVTGLETLADIAAAVAAL